MLLERKSPPIYLASKINDFISFSNQIKDNVDDKFYIKYLGNQIKIQFYKTCDFLEFKKMAIFSNKFLFHTYFLLDDKTITVTLKGLPNLSNLDTKLLQELEINIIT